MVHEKEDKPRSPKKRLRHHHQRRVSRLPGVHKLVLSELLQKMLGCVAGEDVTNENPYAYVKKKLIMENIELHEDSSIFLPIQNEIQNYPNDEILVSLIREKKSGDEIRHQFYIYLSKEAEEFVRKITEAKQNEMERRLQEAVNRTSRLWHDLGTSEEIDENNVENGRSLLEIDVEAVYPVQFANPPNFQTLPVENIRDGYMEMTSSSDITSNFISKRRVDLAVQNVPENVTVETQTICKYPSNAVTQYEYNYIVKEDDEVRFGHYLLNTDLDKICDVFTVNANINLYANDFERIVNLELESPESEHFNHTSFIDLTRCKDKMVNYIDWHPTWSDIVVVTYVNQSSCLHLRKKSTSDTVEDTIFGIHLVILWSINDNLAPKLILESPREVQCARFCISDPNIVAGGCQNGQIIIWDIKNRLEKVEEIEILTANQVYYRHFMDSLMGWMKKTHFRNIVRPTVVSSLQFSHKGPITSIYWTLPLYDVTKLGTIVEILESETFSMQFYTSSEDATILLWDLKMKPPLGTTFKAIPRSKRLKHRPSALTLDVSPYRILHLNLIPKYKLNIVTDNKKKIHPISCLTLNHYPMTVEREEIEAFSGREKYKREFLIPKEPLKPQMYVSTFLGEFIQLQWSGQNFETGELLNSETVDVLYQCQFHDGVVVSLKKSENLGINLTVGGRIFALWDDRIKNRPIFWRKSSIQYTRAYWHTINPHYFSISRIDGCTEYWLLNRNSKQPFRVRQFCSNQLTDIHPAALFMNGKKMNGFGDNIGFFYAQTVPAYLLNLDAVELKLTKNLFEREIQRKEEFWKWQTKWNEKNCIHKKSVVSFEEKQEKSKSLTEETNDRKSSASKSMENPMEHVREKLEEQERARIRNVILSKKQLNTKELEKRKKPIQEMEMENEKKKNKQKQKFHLAETIFKESVVSLFPKIVERDETPPKDPYKSEISRNAKEEMFDSYKQLKDEYSEFVESNEFIIEYDWNNSVKMSQARGMHLFDPGKRNKHWNRLEQMENEEIPRRSVRKVQFDDNNEDSPIMEDNQQEVENAA